MKRGAVLMIVLAAFAAPWPAHAATPVPRIGFLGMDIRTQAAYVAAFESALRAKGYVPGKDVVIEYRWAEGKLDRLPALAAELAAMPVQVIVTAAPPAVRAARGATTTIPIVMMVHDPVGQGFAGSLAHPGGNVTGVAFQDAELSTKRLDLFRKLVPQLTQVAIIWNQAGGGRDGLDVVERAARQLGLRTLAIEVASAGDLTAAVAKAKAWGAQGIVQLASPVITLNRKAFLDALVAHRLPATCEMRMYVAEGCLMTYSASYSAMIGSLAAYVDRILKGAAPGDLPIEQPSVFEFVINETTAKSLGLALPSALRVQTTEVIP